MKPGFARERQGGFTLLELLVAVTLTAIVIVGLMAVFRSMVSVYGQIGESRESAMQMRSLVGLLGDDLRTVSGEFAFIGGTGESGGAGLGGRRTERLLEFVSGISVERQEAEPALTRVLVVYSLAGPVSGEDLWTLTRGERPHPSLSGGWRESPVPVLRNVESLKFFFEGASGAEQDFYSAPPRGVLPSFVRLEAVLRHGDAVTNISLRFPVGPPGS